MRKGGDQAKYENYIIYCMIPLIGIISNVLKLQPFS